MKRPRGRAPASVDAYAAAKINIGWRVGATRADGYHDVQGTLQTISILDRLRVRTGDGRPSGAVEVVMRGVPVALAVDDPSLASEDNLVLRAAAVLARDVEPLPTTITLSKRIPVAAGLGGGSADAAAALTALGLAWSADLDAAGLLARAAQIGSDVPAILLGGLVHASGRGERVRSIGCATGCRFVIGLLTATLATSAVYARLDELRSSSGPRPDTTLHANDLEPAAVSLCPELAPALAVMRDAGAPAVFVSGSGPAVVAVVPDPVEADVIAARVAPAFRSVLVADPTAWGVRLALSARP
jgi:4-diphosphocytidyl-2-C-methyl-D-erythritol kinase